DGGERRGVVVVADAQSADVAQAAPTSHEVARHPSPHCTGPPVLTIFGGHRRPSSAARSGQCCRADQSSSKHRSYQTRQWVSKGSTGAATAVVSSRDAVRASWTMSSG